jgi:ribonuclease HII
MSTYIAGIDEAGRGPVIGPMVMSITALEEEDFEELEKIGVKDSKLLTPEQRENLAPKIRELCIHETIIITPEEIDAAINDPTRNLNILEEEVAAELIDRIASKLGAYKLKEVILDCPSVNTVAYKKSMEKRIKRDVPLRAEHKADTKYPIVGAASILAKTTRDAAIEQLKKEIKIDFGSGYPSDPKTARFVKEHHKDYDIFRKTWETYKRVANTGGQASLAAFGVDTTLPKTVLEKQKKLHALKGFTQIETKGTSELLRIKNVGVTITLYTNGKILIQGKEKEQWEKEIKKL